MTGPELIADSARARAPAWYAAAHPELAAAQAGRRARKAARARR
jgi:hypothetical protein